MKRITIAIVLLSSSMIMLGQATTLLIDNQTPGWLSSKIGYSNQQTLTSIKVTGYINKTDTEFIGTMMRQNLHGVIDLSETEFIGQNTYNLFSQIYNDTPKVQKLLLPYIEDMDVKSLSSMKCDTLLINTKVLKRDMILPIAKHLIIGNMVEEINEYSIVLSGDPAEEYNVTSMDFSNSLKKLAPNIITNGRSGSTFNINVASNEWCKLNNIEYLGELSLWNCSNEFMPDTLFFDNVSEFYCDAIHFKKNMHIYLSEKTMVFTPFTSNNDSKWYHPAINENVETISFHLPSRVIPCDANWYECSNYKIYVPVEFMDEYIEQGWKNIYAEPSPAEEITLTIQQSTNGWISMLIEKGSVQTFAIQAESGWKIHSVTFNDADVTSELDATNHYTTPTITENSTLFVTFEEDTATDVKAKEVSDVRVQGTSFGVRILNATNETANIYTPDGVLVKAVKVAGAQMDVDLPEGGIYLVKVVDKTVKVSR